MIDAFVSYSHGDSRRVAALVDALRIARFKLYWDVDSSNDDDIRRTLTSRLDAARRVLVCWTRRSVESDWVLAEADEALRQNKLLSVCLDDVVLPLPFRRGDAVRMPEMASAGFKRMVEELRLDRADARPSRRRARAKRQYAGPHRDFVCSPEMVRITAGEFLMGPVRSRPSAGTRRGARRVARVPHDFAVGRFPITFKEYARFAADVGRELPCDYGWGFGSRPAIDVSWFDAEAFCAWLSTRTGQAYRLLREAEWEYVARAGTNSRFWWGEHMREGYANYCDGSGNAGRKTSVVGRYPANGFGVFDTSGNVWEWVQDGWTDEPSRCGQVRGSAKRRVLRGGAWKSPSRHITASSRAWACREMRCNVVGFRVAKTLA